ncbi:MAG: 2-oxoacid:acceptor oxidoreductase subunit alpha, partial [Thermoprotei archaeon]
MGQGDIMQVKWGSHGDYEVVAYLPSSTQEFFDMTIEAFNTAEEYRVPVFVLADKIIGQMYGKVTVPDQSEVKLVERKKPSIPPEKYMDYLPYDSSELVPPFAAAGEGYRIHMTGLMHDDRGYPNLSQEASWKLVTRLVRKIRDNAKKIAKWEEYWIDDSEYVIVAYGSVSGPVKYAIKKARNEGYKVGLFRPLTAWPFPGWRIEELDYSNTIKKFIVMEVNMGQMYHVVREYVRNAEVIHIPSAPGYLPEPQKVLSDIKNLCR